MHTLCPNLSPNFARICPKGGGVQGGFGVSWIEEAFDPEVFAEGSGVAVRTGDFLIK
jgi:hypothetical protein